MEKRSNKKKYLSEANIRRRNINRLRTLSVALLGLSLVTFMFANSNDSANRANPTLDPAWFTVTANESERNNQLHGTATALATNTVESGRLYSLLPEGYLQALGTVDIDADLPGKDCTVTLLDRENIEVNIAVAGETFTAAEKNVDIGLFATASHCLTHLPWGVMLSEQGVNENLILRNVQAVDEGTPGDTLSIIGWTPAEGKIESLRDVGFFAASGKSEILKSMEPYGIDRYGGTCNPKSNSLISVNFPFYAGLSKLIQQFGPLSDTVNQEYSETLPNGDIRLVPVEVRTSKTPNNAGASGGPIVGTSGEICYSISNKSRVDTSSGVTEIPDPKISRPVAKNFFTMVINKLTGKK